MLEESAGMRPVTFICDLYSILLPSGCLVLYNHFVTASRPGASPTTGREASEAQEAVTAGRRVPAQSIFRVRNMTSARITNRPTEPSSSA
jgi:hypothetical protein